MKINEMMTSLAKMTGKTGLRIKAASPEILLIVGIVGVIGSTVLACRATLKVEEVLDAHKAKMDLVHEGQELIDESGAQIYSDMDSKMDTVKVYAQTSLEVIKLYGPSVALGTLSMFCIVSSHGIMKQRNVALMAAYQAVEKGFAAYRKRVIAEFGEEKDYMYKNGLTKETVVEAETDEKGKTKNVKKEKLVQDPNGLSVYAKFFDESSSEWSKNPDYNMMMLKQRQTYFNNLLQVRGYVFLNEVYEALGIEQTQAGSIVGWMIGAEGGDGFIDFGIYDGDRPKVREFVNGGEASILLDFNVDGVIYNLFTKKKA